MKETVKKLQVLRTKRAIRVLGFCVFVALLAAGCSLPQAPGDLSWDTHLTIPLGVRTYGLVDMVKPDSVIEQKGSGIGMAADSTLYFSAYSNILVPLRDELTVQAFNSTVRKPAGVTDFDGLAILPAMQHRLNRGLVQHGQLQLTLTNLTNNDTGSVDVTLPAFVNANDPTDTLHFTISNVNASGRTVNQNLFNYYVTLDTADNPQRIHLRIHTAMTEEIRAEMHLDTMRFTYYSGVLHNLNIPNLNSETAVERLPEGWETIHPTDVDVNVHTRSTVNAMANLNVNVTTYLHDQVVATDQFDTTGIHLGPPSVWSHPVGPLFSTFPDSMRAHAIMSMDGPVTNVSGSDTIRLNVELRAPLTFTINPSLHAPGDSSVRKIDNNDLKEIEPDSSNKLTVHIWNHLPVGGHVYLVADTIEQYVYSSTSNPHHAVRVADVSLPIPPLNAQGYAIAEADTELVIRLTDAVVALFKNGLFWTRTDITVNGSGSDTLTATAHDYVKVQIIADIQRHVNTKGDNH